MSNIILESGFSFGGPLNRIVKTIPILSQTRDHFWMVEALREGTLGIGSSNPNPSVGCILVDSNQKEISRGFTQAYPGLHAERVAFNQVKDHNRLNGATAYVTLEPCSHQGNQPPCVDLLAHSNIRRVVIARKDPNPLVCGRGITKLKDYGKEVEVGLLSNESTAWNFPFFGQIALKRPILALKWAQTLDGQLADDSSTSQWITGNAARSYSHWLRQRYDAILVGAQTVLQDCPRLDVRDCPTPHQANPVPIIFDPKGLCFRANSILQGSLSERTFRTDRPLIYLTRESVFAENRNSWIEKKPNVTLLTLPGNDLLPELVELFGSPEIKAILGHALTSVMIEGGPKTLTALLKQGYGDILHVFVAPLLTGGLKHRPFVSQLLPNAKKFKLLSTSSLGEDVLMEMVTQQALKKVF